MHSMLELEDQQENHREIAMKFLFALRKRFKLILNKTSELKTPEEKEKTDTQSLVEKTSLRSLANLDQGERGVREEFFYGKTTLINSEMSAWFYLAHWDGYKREEALRNLSGAAPNSFFLSLAIRRLNDWVPEVRKAASDKLLPMLKETDPTYVVDSLFAILPFWSSWQRIEDPGKEVIFEIISSETVSEMLKEKLISGTSGPLISILTQVCRTPVFDGHLNDIATNAIQPTVRAKACRWQFEGKIVWTEGRKLLRSNVRYQHRRFTPILSERKLTKEYELLNTLRASSTDRSPMVRRIAAEIFIRELAVLGEESLKLAKLFASDCSPSVAERGGFALRKLKEMEA